MEIYERDVKIDDTLDIELIINVGYDISDDSDYGSMDESDEKWPFVATFFRSLFV